jgi:hypothetical protein
VADSASNDLDIIAAGLAQNLVDDPIAQRGDPRVCAFQARRAGDVHHPHAAVDDRDRSARLLRLPHADDERERSRQPVPRPVRVHPVAEHELARRRHHRVRHAQRERDERRVRQRLFDGWTIVTGHEYAKAVTDPDNVASDQDGWNDVQGSENGDKCAWMNTQNSSLGGHAFAVQPLWSNEAFDATGNGCAVKR